MLPGGKGEAGESPAACAIREVREELGVELGAHAVTPLGRFETATANEPGFLLISDVFAARCDGAAAPAAEIDELCWIDPAGVRALAALPEEDCAPWAPLLVRIAREHLV